MEGKKAVALVSGGLDSAVALASARSEGFEVHALTVIYGQRHAAEVDAARTVAATLEVASHRILEVDLASFGGSSLTDAGAELPRDRDEGAMASEIPSTYVPARNTVLLSLALSLAEATGARDLFVGVNAVDYSGYPDCRPAFLEAFENLAEVATKEGVEGRGGFRVRAPLIDLTKAEIVRLGVELGMDLSLTRSCYDLDDEGRACGSCDSCLLRRKGFEEAGVDDPTVYA
ncbi:MAG: 7-cyano-7-deazaguanine synthase QueC [Planctomycetota bacterium]|jgi:7-cyano-7-deazaguanine synthase